MIAAIPLTLFLTGQEQDIRQRAAETAPTASSSAQIQGKICTANNVEVMLAIDRSNSMEKPTSASNSAKRIVVAKAAANSFVDKFGQSDTNAIGVAQFALKGGVAQDFTSDNDLVKKAINALKTDSPSGTCTECAIIATNEKIKARLDAGNKKKKFVILLSDGYANRVITDGDDINNHNNLERGQLEAYNEIMLGHTRDGTIYFTIGLGETPDKPGNLWMKKVAADTGGKYYFAPDADSLQTIYTDIAYVIGKLSVSGVVFEDKDGNKLFDTTKEGPFSGVTVSLLNASSSAAVASVKTDSAGHYSFTEVCPEEYHIVQEEKDGYYLTVPEDPPYYVIDVSKALTDITDKNFGNRDATITFNFKAALHGLGIAGDNVVLRPPACQNTNASKSACLSNQKPNHPTREYALEVINDHGKTVASLSGKLVYNSSTRIFDAEGETKKITKSGQYTFRLHTPMFLQKKVLFPDLIKPGETYQLPVFDLTSSDADDDNLLTILDYNQIISCYTYPNQKNSSCMVDERLAADTDDNGKTDEFDINLFVRDISVLQGD